MEFDKHESARWTQAADQASGEYMEARDKILADDAARGFPMVTGEGLSQLLAVGFKAKKVLTEANGKIYEEERGRINELTEFDLKIEVQFAKLAMEFYRDTLFNLISIEQTEEEVLKEIQRADIERLDAEIERRQGDIIMAKAGAEAEVNAARSGLVVAERASLTAESALINAQLATAEKKVEIIASIYEVIAAENLVLASERQRATAMQETVEAMLELAAVKQAMIPLYIGKGEATLVLAEAITQDAQTQKSIINLGLQRSNLKLQEAQAEANIKSVELNYEIAKGNSERINDSIATARLESQIAVQGAKNRVGDGAIGTRENAEKSRIDTKWLHELARIQSSVSVKKIELNNAISEINNDIAQLVTNIGQIGISERDVATAGKMQQIDTSGTTYFEKRLRKSAQ